MLNFIYKKLGLHGNNYRYKDFFKFLDSQHILYKINDINFNEYHANIIDIVYYYDNTDIKLLDNCYIFCGSEYKILQLEGRNITFDYSRFITHNLYYAQQLKCMFLPMYLYENNINITNIDKKYKYGMFLTYNDSNYLIVEELLSRFNISIGDVLILDRENLMKAPFITTNNKEYFYSSIDCFLDIANDYNNRHVTSRTYLELISNNIPIEIISYYDSEAITLKGFRHIKKELLKSDKEVKWYKIDYNKYFFNTNSYSKYIANLLSKPRNIIYNYVEDYADNR